jgi:hypothetical protein
VNKYSKGIYEKFKEKSPEPKLGGFDALRAIDYS